MRRTSKQKQQIRLVFGIIGLFLVFCLIYYIILLSSVRSFEGLPSLVCIGKSDPELNIDSYNDFINRQIFKINIDVANIPHPQKQQTGGEDSFFISPDKYTFGIYDGVGGWNNLGIDSSEYSQNLANIAKKCVIDYNMRDPLSILCVAEKQSKTIIGSSTACCLTIDKNILYAANLGDSGFLIFRNNHIIFQSEDIIHEFNFPYQIGAYGDGLDSTDEYSIEIYSGDIILVATDGLFDNLYTNEIEELLNQESMYTSKASFIAENARLRSLDLNAVTPHGIKARDAGYYHLGGKPDDITILLVYIE